jgi:hypothetical protein
MVTGSAKTDKPLVYSPGADSVTPAVRPVRIAAGGLHVMLPASG